jgi:hypothetical protein
MPSGETILPDDERDEAVDAPAEDARDGWLDIALADMEGGTAALATAARGGRLTPRKD